MQKIRASDKDLPVQKLIMINLRNKNSSNVEVNINQNQTKFFYWAIVGCECYQIGAI